MGFCWTLIGLSSELKWSFFNPSALKERKSKLNPSSVGFLELPFSPLGLTEDGQRSVCDVQLWGQEEEKEEQGGMGRKEKVLTPLERPPTWRHASVSARSIVFAPVSHEQINIHKHTDCLGARHGGDVRQNKAGLWVYKKKKERDFELSKPEQSITLIWLKDIPYVLAYKSHLPKNAQ